VDIRSRASLPGALRLCLAIAGVCALVFAALWAAAVFQAIFFEADVVIDGGGFSEDDRRSIGILGFLGVLASGAAGGFCDRLRKDHRAQVARGHGTWHPVRGTAFRRVDRHMGGSERLEVSNVGKSARSG